ncbi:uncharacterized protein LOC130621248 [Hydractinia symbiolongicarpus]|uniref:uncharacterized protein LOC130621248 n=1 Tax=Hydractinia symbiolongicarpus TaxID=13093 RepID=UPI00254FD134|nr:uncharacterized protein LOC130621248 [Hydractinia symbiolongicarpus]
MCRKSKHLDRKGTVVLFLLCEKKKRHYIAVKNLSGVLSKVNYSSNSDMRVADHCHYTGKFHGAAHRSCNLRYKVSKYIPIVFHNLSGYDAHLFIKELAKQYGDEKITVIAENKEKYISFSLDVVVGEYVKKGEKKNLRIQLRFIDSGDEQFKLLRRKGVYLYEYVDSFDKFNETNLPAEDAFYSKLNMSGISDADYAHAQKVWKDIKIKNMAWQACLKKIEIKLDLLHDMDMFLFMEKGIRGGLTQAVHRHAKANNKYVGVRYKTTEETSYLQYLDANNLYGWAMIQKLPTGKFKWVDDPNKFMTKLISMLAEENGEKGYILEVDVRYPKGLHDTHNDLPFMPKRMEINGGEQSAWLKPYIHFNTDLRTKSKNDFEKVFFKLMNNSVFGKTMENQRKHKDIRLATKKQQYEKLVMKPNFKGSICFSETLMGVEMRKIKVVLNEPIYLGPAILDLSKIVMYEFHYEYMRLKYDIADDVALRFDTSGYDKKDNRPLLIGLK